MDAPTDAIFKNPELLAGSEPCLPSSRNREILNFEREDWVLFRTVEGLSQRAGVGALLLRRLVLKELCDNALDAGAAVEIGLLPNGRGYFVDDDGPGIPGDPADIARLFSIRRPMVSSKLLRLPTRGALGNGLRVVAGAVLASAGGLVVTTRDRRVVLRPEAEGSTSVVEVTPVDRPVGTRVEIQIGRDIRDETDPLVWARQACELADVGSTYAGSSSPFWYDPAQFHELLLARSQDLVREIVATLDGCSGKAGAIVNAAGCARLVGADIDRKQAVRLLQAARDHARPVKPGRLGQLGEDAFAGRYYAVERGVARVGSSNPQAELPFVAEAWAARQIRGDRITIDWTVNRTPITGTISTFRSNNGKTDLVVSGCGLLKIADVPGKGAFAIKVNLTSPYIPITSDGKAPDLSPFADAIVDAISKAVRRAQRAEPKTDKVSQKDVVLKHLDEAIAKVSGDGATRFIERMIFYVLRDPVMQATGKELTDANLSKIITDYEEKHGEIPGMYREPRGSLLHPHDEGRQVALGTLMVASYERPAWTFNKLLYIEKEGFSQALQAAQWPERHDCAVFSSKGYTTRAARDLVDKLAEHDEAVTVFCVHDADAFGTMIYQTFQEATKARGARKVKIINLGLEPWEALAMGLAHERLDSKDRDKPVASYITDDAPDDGVDWAAWLQTNRVELNAMAMPQFIAWLDDKMAEHGTGKLIPPAEVLAEDLETRIEQKVREVVRERILREARFEDQVVAAVAAVTRPVIPDLTDGIEQLFDEEQDRSWRDHIEDVATDLVRVIGGAL